MTLFAAVPLVLLAVFSVEVFSQDRAIQVRPKAMPARAHDYDPSRFHALLIGIDQYQQVEDLRTAEKDVRAVAAVLQDRYGFSHVSMLLNEQATRNAILTRLTEYRNTLTEEDSLLIYYAGHGRLENDNPSLGHWVPTDGEEQSTVNDIPHSLLKSNYLKFLKVRHLVLLSDSCFSGALHRSLPTDVYRSKNLLESFQKNSRQIVSSGDLQPVPDDAGNGHSPFCNRVLQFLQSSRKPFGVFELCHYLQNNLKTAPVCQPMDTSVHEPGGTFVFVPTGIEKDPFAGLGDEWHLHFSEQAGNLEQQDSQPSAIPATLLRPEMTAETNVFLLSNPKGGILSLGGREYELNSEPELQLGKGSYPFVIHLVGSQRKIYGIFEVFIVDEDSKNAVFGVDAALFKGAHIEAVLRGSPVKYTIGFEKAGNKKTIAQYTLSLRKLY